MGTSNSAVIVGGGPAGALLAFLLSRGGVTTTLIERHTDFAREFRGEGMSPSGMAAIRESGLWDAFDELPWTPLESLSMYSGGKPFLTLDIQSVLPRGMEFIRILGQPHLLEMLVERAAQFPNFTFLRGVAVHEPILEDGRVRGVVTADSEVRADYVIAADGRFSTLRKRLGFELEGEPQVFDVVWCKVRRPSGMVKGRVYSFLLDEFFGLAFPTEHDEVQIGRIIPKGSFKAFRGERTGAWYDHIAASLPPDLAPGFLAVRETDAHPTLLDAVCGSLPRWSAPGICFIGDAAHPMSPIGAQGINIALRDAVIAANHFGPPLLKGATEPAALDEAARTFETERRKEVDRLQAQQSEAPRRLGSARLLAGVMRIVPSGWMAAFGRWILGLRSTRNFIQGVSDLRLTFGKPER